MDRPLEPALPPVDLTEKRRFLQLETLYDLALALHAERPEEELVEELLQQVCAVTDPAAAVAVTRDPVGDVRSFATVGWHAAPPEPSALLAGALWRDLLGEGQPLIRHGGSLAGRPFRELLASPLAYRGVFLGYIALLDKESRSGTEPGFSAGDRRFLDSVAALAGVSLDRARHVAELAQQRERLVEENKALKGRLFDEVDGLRIVATAEPMRRVLEMVDRIAPRGVNVLVRGESGTGKELIAQLLHSRSGRAGSLVAINCAALPEALLESELFGIERGVATGVVARPGKFELADGGTLFLDEIGDMDLMLQAKLLRALQEREVVRLGGDRPIGVDVRVVAATHRRLEDLVAAGSFREDLYYRLQGVAIELPPLRERTEDIPQLVRVFVEDLARREGLATPRITADALAVLLGHDYPGNVRELQNRIEGAVALADGTIDGDLMRSLFGRPSARGPAGGPSAEPPEPDELLDLATVESHHIRRVLEAVGGNKSAAARVLGVDRRTLQRKGW